MASSAQWLLSAGLLLAVMATRVAATEEDYTAKFNYNVVDHFSGLGESFTIKNLSVPQITSPGIVDLKIDLVNISITGYKEITGSQFTYDPDTTIVKMTLTEPSLEIFAHELTMKGSLFGNINIDGKGDGWFLLETLKCSLEGPTFTFNFDEEKPNIIFRDVKLTLDLDQWTVDMRGLTPNSDLIQMANSVLTMLGPEIFHALGDSISNTPGFTVLVNAFFHNPPANETTEMPGETNEEETKVQSIIYQGADWVPQEAMQEFLQLRHPRRMADLGNRS